MKLEVECYSGGASDERPIRFRLGGRDHQVTALADRWYEPDAIFYKVQADDGNLYVLRRQTSTPEGSWDLISFRRAESRG